MKTLSLNGTAYPVSVMDRPLRILHLEDDPRDRGMVHAWLNEQNIAADYIDVDNEADFMRAVKNEVFDIILSDKCLPEYDGSQALRFARTHAPHVPFVFVTGSMGEEAAIQTMRDGATDYVLKDRLSRLIPAVDRAIREAEQAERSRQIEEKNRQQAALLDEAQDAILATNAEDIIVYWNKSAERIYGWGAAEVLGQNAMGILSRDPSQYQEATKALLKNGNWTGEMVTMDRKSRELIMQSRWTLLRDAAGNIKSILIIDTDITEKKALEAKYLRAQRLDSIGALAGGIAHDLNNALAPVLMGTELLNMSDDAEDRQKFLEIIRSNATRATDLVKQILSFARGAGNHRGPVDLHHLLRDMSKMIQDTFPKSIVFAIKSGEDELWAVQGEGTKLHQVLLNLCVNARDAMPQGGQLTITTENYVLTEESPAAPGAAPGSYVMIAVADTGTGIPADVLPHIFEPFFTTKREDTGTGLGLATVAEIVKKHGGFMDVRTEAGRGTEFKIYFPAARSAQAAEGEAKKTEAPLGRGELILLIDDEATLLELTKTMLESFGYKVVTAQNGLEGIARFRENQNEVKLLVTDSDMPQLDGIGVIRAIMKLKPSLPVIVSSGLKRDPAEFGDVEGGRMDHLGKPYSLDQLLFAVDKGLHHCPA